MIKKQKQNKTRANKKNKLENQNQGRNKKKTKRTQHANKINKKKTEENAGFLVFLCVFFFFPVTLPVELFFW